MRLCLRCEELKSPSEFVKNKGLPGGLTNTCRGCHAAYMRRWKIAHPDGIGILAKYQRRYAFQKGDAKRREIPFLLTFEQWLKIWIDSGHIDESGNRSGQYCMARSGDRGAYEVGNVRICTTEENHREMRHSQEKKDKMKGNKYALGYRHSPETLAKISASLRQRHAEATQ